MVEFFYWLKNEVGDFYLNFIFIFFLRSSLACLTAFWKIFSPAQWGPKMSMSVRIDDVTIGTSDVVSHGVAGGSYGG